MGVFQEMRHGGCERGVSADVLCVGETMALVVPADGRLLSDHAAQFRLEVGGAESNVACGIAHFGLRAEWWSRIGDDPFGVRVLSELTDRGVDASRVCVDQGRPTGTFWKNPSSVGTEIYYYRSGSAASAMSVADLAPLRGRASLVHLSGITVALSESCRKFMWNALVERALAPSVISFDVNYRPALWDPADAAETLGKMASAADIVIVGRDEAEELWGTATPSAIRDLLPDPSMVVVKDAEIGATCFAGEYSVFVPSLEVDVVEPVGAGDAFAAGFLAGMFLDVGIEASLRLGHLMAAETLKHVGDLVDLPSAAALVAQAVGSPSTASERLRQRSTRVG